MATQQKIDIVEQYSEKFKEAKAVYLADYTGIDVPTITNVRNKFREAGVEYKVLKNRLARLALNKAGISDLDEYLQGVTAYIIDYNDPIPPAKIIKEFNKKNEILRVKAAYVEGSVMQAEEIKRLADLPSRDQMLAQILGLLQQPMTKLAATLQGSMQKLVRTLDALKDSK